MNHSSRRAKCHAGASRLQRRVRRRCLTTTTSADVQDAKSLKKPTASQTKLSATNTSEIAVQARLTLVRSEGCCRKAGTSTLSEKSDETVPTSTRTKSATRSSAPSACMFQMCPLTSASQAPRKTSAGSVGGQRSLSRGNSEGSGGTVRNSMSTGVVVQRRGDKHFSNLATPNV